jgi:hypothetical protein
VSAEGDSAATLSQYVVLSCANSGILRFLDGVDEYLISIAYACIAGQIA